MKRLSKGKKTPKVRACNGPFDGHLVPAKTLRFRVGKWHGYYAIGGRWVNV